MMFTSELLFVLSLLVTNVTAFAPSQRQLSLRVPSRSNDIIAPLSPMSVVDRSYLFQSRPKSLSLYVMPETGLDPMVITMFLSAGLLAVMAAQYSAQENEALNNSAKTLIADTPAPTKDDKVTSTIVLQTADSPTPTKDSKEPVVAALVASSKKPEKPSDITSLVMDIEESKPKSIKNTSLLARLMSKLAFKLSLLSKVIVKLLMPWRKFATI